MIAALIPAFQPGSELVALTQELAATDLAPIVVVDDGSGPAYANLFRELPARLVTHPTNRGKGAALKTGLASHTPELGWVTLDADGQHRVPDALKVAQELRAHPASLVLGVRDFTPPGVPWRSRLGNQLSRLLFILLTGRRVQDTQTGLRALPSAFVPRLLDLPGTRYEWEFQVLLACPHLRQVPIETIYRSDHPSHYRPLRDTLRILLASFRHGSSPRR